MARLVFGVKALGAAFTPDHWLYNDDDGILVSCEQLVQVQEAD
jgi:regulator of RNase E activity RraA